MTNKRNLLRAGSTRKPQPAPVTPASAAAARFVAGKNPDDKVERKRYSVFLQPEIHERLWKYWANLPAEDRESLSDLIEKLVVEGLDRLVG